MHPPAPKSTHETFQAHVARTLALLRGEIPGARFQFIPCDHVHPAVNAMQIAADWGVGREAALRQQRAFALMAIAEPVRFDASVDVWLHDRTLPGHERIYLTTFESDMFDYALDYFQFNDIGAIAFRLSRSTGLRLLPTGLYCRIRLPAPLFAHYDQNVVVSHDWNAVLGFLAYDAALAQRMVKWKFRVLASLYRFCTRTLFSEANRPFLKLSESPFAGRARPKLTGNANFLASYLTDRTPAPAPMQCASWPQGDWGAADLQQKVWLERAWAQFPGFQDRYDALLAREIAADRAERCCDNDHVRALLGVNRARASEIMRVINGRFDTFDAQIAWMERTSQPAIDQAIIDTGSDLRAQRERTSRQGGVTAPQEHAMKLYPGSAGERDI